MPQIVVKSCLLLIFVIIVCCGIYPLALWSVGETFFPFQANGSLLRGVDNNFVGSKLIAQAFTRDEYFHPRPSAAFYNPTASASSALSPSNYALRDRVARMIGPVVTYSRGPKAGQPVAPDIIAWFKGDTFKGHPHILAQWASMYPILAAKQGKMPIADSDVPSIFFDMWRQDHPDVELQNVPGDWVTTSASGLDPYITLKNAEFQLDRVAAKWAADLKRDPVILRAEIEQILKNNAQAPFYGLIGENIVNVLEVNIELNKKYRAS